MEPDAQTLIEMYRKMQTIRHFELKAREVYERNLMRGTLHLYIGQEAVAVGACMALEPEDCITSTHRGHGHCIAKGADLGRMMAELLGRETGYCRGRGGSMHIADFSKGILGANGIVGGGIPLATGAALGFQVMGEKRVAVCFFGEGAANQGNFHESANLASIWKLPVIYLCENNLYALSTPARTAFPHPDIAIRGAAYDMPGISVDGQDVLAVYEAVSRAVSRARRGEGPTVIEAKTYRFEGHFMGDIGGYRTEEEIEEWKRRDPIVLLKEILVERGILDEREERAIVQSVEQAIAGAEEFALASPRPEPAAATDGIYTGVQRCVS